MSAAMIVLIAVTALAAVLDVRSRRIPNALTGAAAAAALLVHLPEGAGATGLAALVMVCAFAAGMLAFAAGWFGGGDVKLMAAACGIAGLPGAIPLALDILIAGAVVAVVAAAARGRFMTLVRSTAAVAAHGVPLEGSTVPYAVAIAAGSAVYAASSLVPALRLPL